MNFVLRWAEIIPSKDQTLLTFPQTQKKRNLFVPKIYSAQNLLSKVIKSFLQKKISEKRTGMINSKKL